MNHYFALVEINKAADRAEFLFICLNLSVFAVNTPFYGILSHFCSAPFQQKFPVLLYKLPVDLVRLYHISKKHPIFPMIRRFVRGTLFRRTA